MMGTSTDGEDMHRFVKNLVVGTASIGVVGLALQGMLVVWPASPSTLTPAQQKHAAEFDKVIADRVAAAKQAQLDDQTGTKCINPKKRAVRIGDSTGRVLGCGWGNPIRINRTITKHGKSEQWVYDGHHNYLYFHDDTLVAIQN